MPGIAPEQKYNFYRKSLKQRVRLPQLYQSKAEKEIGISRNTTSALILNRSYQNGKETNSPSIVPHQQPVPFEQQRIRTALLGHRSSQLQLYSR